MDRNGSQMCGRGLASVALGVIALVAGCNTAGGVGEVSGRVEFEGNPLPLGRITFYSQVGSKKVVAVPINDGKYSGAQCPVGEAKLTIESFGRSGIANMPKGVAINPAGLDENLKPVKALEIPARYRDPEQSGLSYTVTKGSQTKDFELTK